MGAGALTIDAVVGSEAAEGLGMAAVLAPEVVLPILAAVVGGAAIGFAISKAVGSFSEPCPVALATREESGEAHGKVGDAPTSEELEGKSPEEIDQMMKGRGWRSEPTRDGAGSGVRYPNPDRPGEQVRVMPGKSTDPNPVKQGPYGRISAGGKVSPPIPLEGNPTLK